MAVTHKVNRLSPLMRQGNPIQGWTSVATWVDVIALSANTAKDYTLKPGCRLLRFTPDVIPCYGSVAATAVLPTADVTDGSASFPIGAQTFLVIDADTNPTTVSLISASDSTVTIEVWN